MEIKDFLGKFKPKKPTSSQELDEARSKALNSWDLLAEPHDENPLHTGPSRAQQVVAANQEISKALEKTPSKT